jgi:hypothetical protein
VRQALIASSIALLAGTAACDGTMREIQIETPILAKLDVSMFQRVLVAGFLAGGTDEVDGNTETVRLLRIQLRNKSELNVIDADALPLLEESDPKTGEPSERTTIKNEEDLELREHLFANADYWKRIGEEYQNPLIVTGTVMFTPHTRSGYVQREEEVYDTFGRRSVVPIRSFQERKGYILKPKFIFIDGRTGGTLYSETFREEVLYNADHSTPALSSYFELMERLMPSFLNTLSSQKIKGSRILLQ